MSGECAECDSADDSEDDGRAGLPVAAVGVRSSPAVPEREVHVMTTASSITSYMDVDRSGMICFRCGQTGHARYQCLTFKVRMCWHHQQGRCNEPNCAFAHGANELRQPWKARCVRVIKHGGELVCIGCNSTEHTFRKCPLHQDLILL
jgi:hypothetical protein